MTTIQMSPTKVNRRLSGAPFAVASYTLQPVAHLTGWQLAETTATASGGAAWLRLAPVAVQVTPVGQPAYTVPIRDPAPAQRWLWAGLGLAIALIFGTINLLLRRWFG